MSAPYHLWGDDSFDWKGLDDCIHLFYVYCNTYGRIGFNIKEKYGTMRLDGIPFINNLHSLIWPGYHYTQWDFFGYYKKYPKIRTLMSKIDYYWVPTFLKYTGLGKVLFAYQRLIFNICTLKCVNKYPHLKDEIMDELEFKELLYNWVKNKTNYKCYWNIDE